MSEDNLEENLETGLDLERGWRGKIKDWVIDSWQTIIIILIILIIGVGLYNYQQQKSADTGEKGALSTAVEEQEETTENSDRKIAFEDDWNGEKDEDSSAIVIEENANQENKEKAENEKSIKTDGADKNPVTITSENGKEYAVSAETGDGITHLARKALKKYLEESDVSDINDEQKIFAEDYLQNKTGHEFLKLGETREFSENLIKEAIDLSRGLDDNDIENLSKYKSGIANL